MLLVEILCFKMSFADFFQSAHSFLISTLPTQFYVTEVEDARVNNVLGATLLLYSSIMCDFILNCIIDIFTDFKEIFQRFAI